MEEHKEEFENFYQTVHSQQRLLLGVRFSLLLSRTLPRRYPTESQLLCQEMSSDMPNGPLYESVH